MFAQCALHAHILDLIQCMKVSPRAEYLRNVLWATRWIQYCYISHSVFPKSNSGHCALLEHGFRFIFFWLSLIFLPCFEPQNFISPPAPPFWMADQVDEAGTHLPLGRAPNTSTHVSKDSKFQIHHLKSKIPNLIPKVKNPIKLRRLFGRCWGSHIHRQQLQPAPATKESKTDSHLTTSQILPQNWNGYLGEP